MRILFAILLSWPAVGLAQSADVISPRIAALESGVICAPPATGETPAPGTIAGVTHLIDTNPPFVSTRNRVPAVLGIGFGVKATASAPEGLSEVIMTVTHPPIGPDGVRSQTFVTGISGESQSLTFYQFDYPYELRPGLWQMEASVAGDVVYSVQFEVVQPQQIPELAQICGFENLLS